MHCEELIATPINLGSSELISVNQLVSLAEEIGGVKLSGTYNLDAPKGVAGRNSDNTMIQRILGWQPSTPFRDGLAKTYAWIEQQIPGPQGRQADGPRHDLKAAARQSRRSSAACSTEREHCAAFQRPLAAGYYLPPSLTYTGTPCHPDSPELPT